MPVSILNFHHTSQVLSALSDVDEWTFDSFALSEATGGRPLSTLAFSLFKTSGIIEALNLDEGKLARCVDEGKLARCVDEGKLARCEWQLKT